MILIVCVDESTKSLSVAAYGIEGFWPINNWNVENW